MKDIGFCLTVSVAGLAFCAAMASFTADGRAAAKPAAQCRAATGAPSLPCIRSR